MGAVKIQEGSRTDLRHDEVDGHSLAGEKIEELKGCWRKFLLEFLESSKSAAAKEVDLGL